jgi:hypothetical protein
MVSCNEDRGRCMPAWRGQLGKLQTKQRGQAWAFLTPRNHCKGDRKVLLSLTSNTVPCAGVLPCSSGVIHPSGLPTPMCAQAALNSHQTYVYTYQNYTRTCGDLLPLVAKPHRRTRAWCATQYNNRGIHVLHCQTLSLASRLTRFIQTFSLEIQWWHPSTTLTSETTLVLSSFFSYERSR